MGGVSGAGGAGGGARGRGVPRRPEDGERSRHLMALGLPRRLGVLQARVPARRQSGAVLSPPVFLVVSGLPPKSLEAPCVETICRAASSLHRVAPSQSFRCSASNSLGPCLKSRCYLTLDMPEHHEMSSARMLCRRSAVGLFVLFRHGQPAVLCRPGALLRPAGPRAARRGATGAHDAGVAAALPDAGDGRLLRRLRPRRAVHRRRCTFRPQPGASASPPLGVPAPWGPCPCTTESESHIARRQHTSC